MEHTHPRRGAGTVPDHSGAGNVQCRARPRPCRRSRTLGLSRPNQPPQAVRRRRIRPDLLPRQIRLHPVGDRATRGDGEGRTSPPAGRERRRRLHREPRPVLTIGHQRGSASRLPRPDRCRLHPPRLPRRRPRPTYPRHRQQQGASHWRGRHHPVDGHRWPPAAQGHRLCLRALQHPPRSAPVGPARSLVRRS